jgi:hypothetical protein
LHRKTAAAALGSLRPHGNPNLLTALIGKSLGASLSGHFRLV